MQVVSRLAAKTPLGMSSTTRAHTNPLFTSPSEILMSKTYVINGQMTTLTGSTHAHQMQTAVERAMHEGNVVDSNGNLPTKFTFDLLGYIRNIAVNEIKDKVLDRLAFQVDNSIRTA